MRHRLLCLQPWQIGAMRGSTCESNSRKFEPASRLRVRMPTLKADMIAQGIGAGALGFHPVCDRVMNFTYTTLLPALHTPSAITVCKWGLASLLILPQSILLGMTFPLMSGGFGRHFPDRPGAALAALYFANSLGGAIGVLASGFVLIRLLGLPYTMAVAGVINIGLAGLVGGLARGAPSSSG